jgi:hypothetical protein
LNTKRLVIVALCIVAAVRVFIFSAAFPFFNNVDEQSHVDLVLKYSHGYLPRGLEHFSAESAPYLTLYRSPEYFVKPEQIGGNYPPPAWTPAGKLSDQELRARVEVWQSRVNHESGEPPIYYVLAASWLDFGRLIGLEGGTLLYWVRFLNVLIAAAVVWFGAATATFIFPDRQFVQIGVPLLLAVWPQSALYSVQPDALSPLSFGIAFLALIKLLRTDARDTRLAIVSGVALAATALIKTSNLALLVVVALAILFKACQLTRDRALGRSLPAFIALFVFTAAPIGIWFAWNLHTFGDLTATASKIHLLGWTRKPIADWWSHPIFTLHGLNAFASDLTATFWRGEFVWHRETLASPIVDVVYQIASALAFGLAVFALIPRFSDQEKWQRHALWLALGCFMSLVGFLALLSISFDFGSCVYPSREFPYFTSGRLLDAAVVPFFLVFVYAIDWITSRTKIRWLSPLVLVGFALFVAITGTVVDWPAFGSRYNFFHMWQ